MMLKITWKKMLYLSVLIPKELGTGIMSNFLQARTSLRFIILRIKTLFYML